MSNNTRKPVSSSPRPPKPPLPNNSPSNSPQAKTPLSARAAVRKPGVGNRSSVYGAERVTDSDEDARAQSAALVQDLKQQLEKTIEASESYEKQANILQLKLDGITKEHAILEEQTHEHDSKVLALQDELMDLRKHRRETERAFEAERAQMLDERERQTHREQELQSVIQRLNENIKQKEMRNQLEGDRPGISRSSSFRNRASPNLETEQFSPSATTLERSPSRNNSKLLLQKDKMIESLRLELAEAQIKLAEMEHMGDGRFQELEKTLLETRMANARLMEDNESFQLLLSQKTLKGDFLADSRIEAPAAELGSLADELEAPSPTDLEGESEAYRKLEAELKSQRDSNKALTLYIDKIIGRLLQHEGFEHIIHEKDDGDAPPPPPKRAATEKALPPAPTKDTGPSLLQRARSVVAGQGARPQPQQVKARPMSYMAPTREESEPTANENPETAPSIPLSRTTSVRGHRRSRSDQAEVDGAAAAAVVGQMYKGSPKPVRTTSGGPISPGTSPSLVSSRPAFFSANPGASRSVSGTGSGIASSTGAGNASGVTGGSSSNSVISDHSGDSVTGTSSPPRTNQGAGNNFTGAVMKQNQLRPLRLVRENEDEAAKKKANRGSWIGWFNRAPEENAKPGT